MPMDDAGGMRAGAYRVDGAMHSSGPSSAQLAATSTVEVLRMALGP